MFKAFTIGIELKLKGAAIAELEAFSKQVSELSAKLDPMATGIKALQKSFQGLNRTLKNTSSITEFIEQDFRTLSAVIVSAFTPATNEINALNASLRETKALSGSLGRRGSFRRLDDSLLGSGAAEAATGFGLRGARSMITSAVIGGAPLAAAVGTGMLVHRAWEQGAEFAQLKALYASEGFGAQAADVAAQNALNSNLPGVSKVDYLRAEITGATATKNNKFALAFAPQLAKINAANKILLANQGRTWSEADAQNLTRFVEIGSGGDTSKIGKWLEWGEHIITMEGGQLPSSYVMSAGRRGGAVLQGLSFDGLVESMVIAQKLTGSTTFSSERVLESQMMRGQVFKTGKGAEARLKELGVLRGSLKHPIVNDAELLKSNPIKWLTDFYIGQLKKHGITSDSAIQQEVFRDLTGTLPTLALVSYHSRQQLANAVALSKHSYGSEKAYSTSMNLPTGQIAQLSSAFKNLMKTISDFSNPIVIAGINALTSAMQGLDNFFRSNSTVIKQGLGVGKSIVSSVVGEVGNAIGGAREAVSVLTGGESSGANLLHVGNRTYNESLRLQALSSSQQYVALNPLYPHPMSGGDTHVHVNLDGDEIAHHTVKKINNGFNRAGSYGNNFDPNISYIQNGLGTING